MANISIKDIENLAELAKLSLTTDEKESYQKSINDILGYISMIENANTEGIVPKYNFHSISKEDEVRANEQEYFSLPIILKNVRKLSSDNFIEVEKVINK